MASTARKTTAKRPAARRAPPAKPIARTAAKPAAKSKAPAAPARAANGAAAKAEKPRKPKLVRDSFTIPKTEYAVLEALKLRAAKAGKPAKKSELLRAGIQALAGMAEPAFLAAVGSVPAIKTGRPAKT